MIIDVEEERLLVISDLHLGNPASTAERRLLGFLDHAADIGASVCIDGDGFDMLQTSFSRLVSASLPVLEKLRRVQRGGGRVYYVVGNHDIVLEHFLENVLVFGITPFLNVRSGGKRIRVEHGHLYDPIFSRYPRLYDLGTRAAGLALFLHKDVYGGWARASMLVDSWRRRRAGDASDSFSPSHTAAEMLLGRGFDVVIFGHTHHAEQISLPSGMYVNAGNWMKGSTYVDIDRGEVQLRTWHPVASAGRTGARDGL